MNEGKKWIWTVIQGVIALVLGLFILLGGETASTTLAWFFGIFLLTSGAIQLWRGLFNRWAAGGTVDLIIGLIGVIGGGIALLLLWLTNTSIYLIYTILAITFVAYGAVGLFETLFARGRELFSWGDLVVDVLTLVLGVMIFVSRAQEFTLNFWAGLILTLIGLTIAGYAFLFQRGKGPQVVAPAPKPDPTPAPKPVQPPPVKEDDTPSV